jgi:uncharacterized protein (DUF433 family)
VIREDIWRSSSPAFTVPEVSALLDLPERKVRKEIELGVLPESSPPRLPFAAVVCLLAIAEFEAHLPLSPQGRKSLYAKFRDSLACWQPDQMPADILIGNGFVRVQVKQFVRDALARVRSFLLWKRRRVVVDPTILGGEPVFKGSRLSVRHIGGLPAGEHPNVLEDYPYLSREDIHFAAIYSRAYPRLGRPRESTETPHR